MTIPHTFYHSHRGPTGVSVEWSCYGPPYTDDDIEPGEWLCPDVGCNHVNQACPGYRQVCERCGCPADEVPMILRSCGEHCHAIVDQPA